MELCVDLLCMELCVDLLCMELCVDPLYLVFGLVWMETGTFCWLQWTSQSFDLPGGGLWV